MAESHLNNTTDDQVRSAVYDTKYKLYVIYYLLMYVLCYYRACIYRMTKTNLL